ncbi:MAG: CoA transferase [Betaproteobacteria bacterium]|nr:CoA transferase [Betaproteobacteria bacterium]
MPLTGEDAGGPLAGVRVLDLTTVLMGPYATQVLGDMGADVIKIESRAGDTVRGIGPMRHAGMGHIFLHVNRNKRSVVLDLKHPDGLGVLLDLVKTADVLVYNLRPRAMHRLGLTWERLSAINARLVFAGLYGYSERGPYAGRPAYDDLIQGATGIPSLMARASGGEPRYVPLPMADRTVGLMGANAILGAIVARARTGRGQCLEVPMFETLAQITLSDHLAGETFVPPLGPTGYPRLLVRERRPFRTLDGHLCVMPYSDAHWRRFLDLVGRPDLFEDDPRLATIDARTRHIGELYALVGEALATRTTQEWMTALDAADIPAMPMHDIDALARDEHLLATGFVREVEHPTEGRLLETGAPAQFSDTPAAPGRRPAPRLGEHSAEVLRELGYDDAGIARLAASGAVVLASNPASMSGACA